MEHEQDSEPIDAKVMKKRVRAWALWDWGSAAFNAVVTTFVFSTYLASDFFIDQGVINAADGNVNDPGYVAAQAANTSVISLWMAIAGFAIALIAPVLGQRSDGSGRRKFWLGVNTFLVVALMAAMFFVAPQQEYLVLGAVLLAVGNIFFEFASVNYNAMLLQVSNKDNMGRISGFGWGMGYIGGIVLLLILLVLFIQNFGADGVAGIFNTPSSQDGGALNIRLAIVASAVWFGIFAIPVLLKVPELPKQDRGKQPNYFTSYMILFKTIGRLAKNAPNALLFLLASAVFRDGMSAIFTFGAIIAAQVFGFSSNEVIYFAIVANIVAGVGTFIGGSFDDKVGPKTVINVSLIAMIIMGTIIMFVPRSGETGGWIDGTIGFWIFGLILCLFVGPVQSASRSFLARITPPGKEGELFGLYATTGRAVGFLASALIAVLIAISEDTQLGIIGIVIVLALGFVLMIPVKSRQAQLDTSVNPVLRD